MALSTRLLAACPYLRPPDFRGPFFLDGMEILLQFSDEIVQQGWHSTIGAEKRTRNDLWRISVRQRTYLHASAHTNVQQHFVVSCHLNAYQFIDSFGVVFMRREFLKSAATCGVAGTLPQRSASKRMCPGNQIHRRTVPWTKSH
jgi:hypothetical protein